ncbi:RIB43A-domain-containing protein [Paraphysoderma sedebokerense]|nr:RIB43A-domain-containing protein [Paraphysoderma sedebokerense]
MFRLDPKPDILQEKAIRRKQRLETERKERILDPKSRTLGIDVNALEEQIKLKNELKASEKEKNEHFDRVTMETNQLLQILDQKVTEARKQNERALVEYRRQHQQPHAQKETDLNDLSSLKKMNLININCDDGVRSLKFEGEDEKERERLRLQKEQMRLWTIQKIQEKEKQIKQEMEEERQRVEYNKAIAAKIHELTRTEERNRKSVAISDREANARLAAEKKLREALAKKQELEENTKEIQALMNGSLPTERSASLPQHSADRTLTDPFNGKPLNGIHEVHQVLNHQLSEKETRKMKEVEEAKSWAAQEFWNNRTANLLEREKDRHKKEAAKKLMLDNLKQAQEFKERQHYINKTVYTNKPADEYFAQFNTTSR